MTDPRPTRITRSPARPVAMIAIALATGTAVAMGTAFARRSQWSTPDPFDRWAAAGPVEAAMTLLGALTLGLAAYLAAAGLAALVVRLLQRPHLVRLTDRWTIPVVRRAAAATAGLVVLTAGLAGPVGARSGPLPVDDASAPEPGPGTATMRPTPDAGTDISTDISTDSPVTDTSRSGADSEEPGGGATMGPVAGTGADEPSAPAPVYRPSDAPGTATIRPVATAGAPDSEHLPTGAPPTRPASPPTAEVAAGPESAGTSLPAADPVSSTSSVVVPGSPGSSVGLDPGPDEAATAPPASRGYDRSPVDESTNTHADHIPADPAAPPRERAGKSSVPGPNERSTPTGSVTGSVTGSDAGTPKTWLIAPGDHLWSVAERTLVTAWGRPPSEREVDRYWRRVVDANRHRLPDPANPDLVHPGLEVLLPAPPPDR